ncbi:MAG: nickel pincer cofactor-dependent isomerase, group 22 [Desulfitobacteriaceae bacterium]
MQSLDLKQFADIPLPKFIKVRQHFPHERIEDVAGEVIRQLESFSENLYGKSIAIGVGSRGVNNIALVTKTVVDFLLAAGARPYIIPAMGSHGGATAEGQAEVLASYGINAGTMGVPVDARMSVESIGELEQGLPIYVAKSALEADGIVVIARVKPHTAFRGQVESGVAKMLTIGLGKQIGADSLHHQGFGRFAELIPKAAQYIVERTKVLFSVALVENAYEETARIEVLNRDEIWAMDREIALLEESKSLMGKILFPEFDVLVIEEIGKNVSGDGQDPNVTGLYVTKYASGGPRFQKCAIFDLTEETHGNANGMGVADVISRDLFDKVDFVKTYTNSFTSTEILPVKVPMVAASKEDALRIAVKTCNGVEPLHHRIVWIKNTLELGEVLISEPLAVEARMNPQLEVLMDARSLSFVDGKPELLW